MSEPTKPMPQDGRIYVWFEEIQEWFDVGEKTENVVVFIKKKDYK